MSRRSRPAIGELRLDDALRARIALMIVGTPRSGTTLVQRLVAESSGLPTVPETHMFTVFAPRLLRRQRFPLAGPDLRSALDWYVSLKQHRGGAPDASALYDRLDGRASSLVEVFLAVVSELSPGSERVVEKTPDHLLWLQHLAPALPDTRFIAVVRDPRAVFASTSQVHWGQRNAIMASARWSRDQRLLRFVQERVDSDRLLVLRYEDLVRDESAVVERLGAFTGHDDGLGASAGVELSAVFREHEQEWKGRVGDPVTAERVEAWRTALSTDDVARIERICRAEMASFGYEPSIEPSRPLNWRDQADRLHYRTRRLAHESRIRHSYVPRAGLRTSR